MVKPRPHLAIAALTVCLAALYPSSSAYAAPDAGVVTIPSQPDAVSTTPTVTTAPTQPPVTTPSTDAPPAPTPPPVTADSEDGTLAQTLWGAIQSKDWFLAVGAALALVIHAARWLLKKKWPSFEKDRWGWFLAAGISGFVAVATALLAGKDAAAAHTMVGALKIFAAAIATYVSTKKLAPSSPELA